MTDTISQRLRPLLLAQLLQGVAPWVPVEKVFMTELGFTRRWDYGYARHALSVAPANLPNAVRAL